MALKRNIGSTGSGSSVRGRRGVIAPLALASVALTLTGCNNALQGGATGAAAGALVGMGLGSLSGNMGEGAAAGALIGGLGGAILGDQNRRADERSGYYRQDYYGGGGYYYNDAPRYRGREYCP